MNKIKRIIIIFLIAFYLLSFTEVSYLAQESNISAGELWNLESAVSKDDLIIGFWLGLKFCIVKIFPMLIKKTEENLINYEETKRIKEVWDLYDYLDTNISKIKRVIDDLYKDPANTHIPFYVIIDIAYKKLKGENIEPLLQEARKRAFQYPWR